jgi:hypothetical protein
MKNLKIYSIIVIFAMGIMLVSCAGEPIETNLNDTTTVDALDGLADDEAAFDEAMGEIESVELDDTSIELDGLKEFNETVKNQDFDSALLIYSDLIDTYSEKLKNIQTDDAEAAQELNEISKTLSQISMSIFENRAALSKDQTSLLNQLDAKFQEIDK